MKIRAIIFLAGVVLLTSCASHQPIITTKKASYKKGNTTVTVNTKSPATKTTTKKTAPNSNTKSAEKIYEAAKESDKSSANVSVYSKSEILEATTRVKVTTAMVLDYIDAYKGIAKSNMKQYGIPASIIIAQGILESGAGTGPLSVLANNHFGIKCHKEWTGPSVKYDDDSEQECFRKYDQPSESYADHSLFLTSRSRYESLFLLDKDDYKKWAKGLKDAGYATDPKYPEKLIGIIERYQLNKYDSEVLGTPFVPIVTAPANDQVASNPDLYQVNQGDTLYSISKKFNISIDDLIKKNQIQNNAISIGQSLIIK